MPIYEYQCQSCDKCFERLIYSGDEAAVKCPRCNDDKVTKQITCASFMKAAGVGKCASDSPRGFS